MNLDFRVPIFYILFVLLASIKVRQKNISTASLFLSLDHHKIFYHLLCIVFLWNCSAFNSITFLCHVDLEAKSSSSIAVNTYRRNAWLIKKRQQKKRDLLHANICESLHYIIKWWSIFTSSKINFTTTQKNIENACQIATHIT